MTDTSSHDRPASDRVRLCGLQFYGYHGATPQERDIGQRFEIDVEMAVDAEAIVDGDLSTPVDYRDIYAICEECCTRKQYRLIEVMAREIVHDILSRFPLPGVRVTVRKPCVPLGGVVSVGAEAVVARGMV